jgi:two-component system KDP operon response regulator KdpE
MSASRILVVDDDPQIRRVMRMTLTAHGYQVNDARSGEEAREQLRSGTYDLVLLDMNMPGMGGMEACRMIRSVSDIAIIMLTVNSTEQLKVEALNAGADDYVTKPFSTPELVARIRASLRRIPQVPSRAELQPLEALGVNISLSSREVSVNGRTSRLTAKEFDLLSYFLARPNRTIAHRELLQAVWGPDHGDELEYVRVFVNRLRKKIEPDPAQPTLLVTDAWAGYRFHLEQPGLPDLAGAAPLGTN